MLTGSLISETAVTVRLINRFEYQPRTSRFGEHHLNNVAGIDS